MEKEKEVEKTAASTVADNNKSSTNEYVVIREGFRVSNKSYVTPDDPDAIAEQKFWENIARNHSYGEPVTIVEYDTKNRLHRVW